MGRTRESKCGAGERERERERGRKREDAKKGRKFVGASVLAKHRQS